MSIKLANIKRRWVLAIILVVVALGVVGVLVLHKSTQQTQLDPTLRLGDDPKTTKLQGNFDNGSGDYNQKAVEYYKNQNISNLSDSQKEDYYLNLGDLQMTAQMHKDACSSYASAVALDSKAYAGHLGLARCLAAQGKKQASKDEYSKVTQLVAKSGDQQATDAIVKEELKKL